MTTVREEPVRATGTGTVRLPEGMTQEQADALVAEADLKTQTQHKGD